MGGFELEEALFATAPVGLHCVDAKGVILWANRTELNFLGFSKEEYVGRYVSTFVYSDKQVDAKKDQQQQGSSAGGQDGTVAGGGAQQQQGGDVEQQGDSNSQVNLITANDRTLYKEVLKRVAGGNPIREIPVRFVTRSGTVIHLLLDCDGAAILRPDGVGGPNGGRYYRFFTRDDTARRIQEMRSNVLFQETNRSLQMLDNFMNRSMQQMRAPLTLMEKACNLVAENIEDIDEVIRRNAAVGLIANGNGAGAEGGGAAGNAAGIVGPGGALRRSSSGPRRSFEDLQDADGECDNGKPHALQPTAPTNGQSATAFDNGAGLNFPTAPLTVALSATLEARSVVGLATTLTKDALALVDDITDLCRFDQGRVLLIEKEAVKVRDICLEALLKVPIPVGSGGAVDVVLDIHEGAPGRTMTDRGVLQRSLALLLNFAVDAAANAASTAGDGARGRVILSASRVRQGGAGGGKSALKISVFYTNPPHATGDESIGIMGSAHGSGVVGGALPVETSATASFASASSSLGGNVGVNHSGNAHGMGMTSSGGGGGSTSMTRGTSFGTLPAIFGECYSKPANEDSGNEELALLQNYRAAQGGSMMRRIRLRESIQGGMTSCRRDKLGLGLSLLYHLVGAQGSDLRYEIVTEQFQPGQQQQRRVVLPSMTKFWFLLPMSLDFPDRLPAEHIVKDDSQGGNGFNLNPQAGGIGSQQALSGADSLAARAPMLSSGSMAPPEPRKKRAKLSHQPQQQQPLTADPLNRALNNILGANVMGGAMDHQEPAQSVASALASSAVRAEPKEVPSYTATTAIAVAATTAATTTTKKYPGVAPGARPLVLVVEDTDVSASLLCMHLRKLNCTSHRAENGEVAIEMLRSAPTPDMYSLILMDLRMPVMDGFEATKVIKGSNASNIPVVALTGETSEENRRMCDEIGFDDYKTKPLKRPQLKELLNKLVPGYTSVS